MLQALQAGRQGLKAPAGWGQFAAPELTPYVPGMYANTSDGEGPSVAAVLGSSFEEQASMQQRAAGKVDGGSFLLTSGNGKIISAQQFYGQQENDTVAQLHLRFPPGNSMLTTVAASSNVGSPDLLDHSLNVSEGFVSKAYRIAGEAALNPHNPWGQRIINGGLAIAAAPLSFVELAAKSGIPAYTLCLPIVSPHYELTSPGLNLRL